MIGGNCARTYSKMKKEQIIISEDSMRASTIFNDILQKVQSSQLNFSLQLTPFSAIISLKKSIITDKNGSPLVQPPCQDFSFSRYEQLESAHSELKINYEKSVSDLEDACIKIHALESQLKQAHSNEEYTIKEYKNKVKTLENALNKKNEDINSLKLTSQNARDVAKKLNGEINVLKQQYNEEKSWLLKEHRVEVKQWKKDLGNANGKLIKLRKEMQHANEPQNPEKNELLECHQQQIKFRN